jgi:hypothetical protein
MTVGDEVLVAVDSAAEAHEWAAVADSAAEVLARVVAVSAAVRAEALVVVQVAWAAEDSVAALEAAASVAEQEALAVVIVVPVAGSVEEQASVEMPALVAEGREIQASQDWEVVELEARESLVWVVEARLHREPQVGEELLVVQLEALSSIASSAFPQTAEQIM